MGHPFVYSRMSTSTWLSANVKTASPMHIRRTAAKSKMLYFFPWITMPPMSTGINLQLLKMTLVGKFR